MLLGLRITWAAIFFPGGWKSFSKFFVSEVKPGMCAITSPDDPGLIISSAGSTYDSDYLVNNILVDLGVKYVSGLHDLLQVSQYVNSFKNRLFIYSFLNTNDYHRQHAPLLEQLSNHIILAKEVNSQPVSFNVTSLHFKEPARHVKEAYQPDLPHLRDL